MVTLADVFLSVGRALDQTGSVPSTAITHVRSRQALERPNNRYDCA